MRPFALIGAVLLVLLISSQAFALYDGSAGWTVEYDFTSGLMPAGWDNHGGVINGGAVAGLFLPDSAYATLSTGIRLGGSSVPGAVAFVMQADVYVGSTNYLQDSGIAAMRAYDNKGPYIIGGAYTAQGMASGDKSWAGTVRRKSWGLAVGQWTTIQIDYGYTNPGFFTTHYTACPGNGAGWPAGEWETVMTTMDTHPNDVFPTLRMGAAPYYQSGGAWAQAVYSNFKLKTLSNVVPEPVSIVSMGMALIGFAGIYRRK